MPTGRGSSAYSASWRFFRGYDLLLTPTTAVPPFEHGLQGPSSIDGREVDAFYWMSFTFPFNLTGQPAASVPAGFTSDGLPVGLQIVGRRFDDGLVATGLRGIRIRGCVARSMAPDCCRAGVVIMARRPDRALRLRAPRSPSPVPQPVRGRIRRRAILVGLINGTRRPPETADQTHGRVLECHRHRIRPDAALLWERLALRHNGVTLGQAALFNGLRSSLFDEIDGDEVGRFLTEGVLDHVHVAASRAQPGRRKHVQDRLRQQGPLVWRLLTGGGYVCVRGSRPMRDAVRAALIDVVAQHAKMPRTRAEAFVTKLENAGRYRPDLWA